MLKDFIKRTAKSKKGMTLLEVIVGLAIFTVVISSVMMAFAVGINDIVSAQELNKNSETVKNFLSTLSETDSAEVSVYVVDNYTAHIRDEFGGETLMTIKGKCLIAKNKEGKVVKYMKLTNEQIKDVEGGSGGKDE